jgi:hypothetical protein
MSVAAVLVVVIIKTLSSHPIAPLGSICSAMRDGSMINRTYFYRLQSMLGTPTSPLPSLVSSVRFSGRILSIIWSGGWIAGGRSLVDLVNTLQELNALEVGFVSGL